MPIGGALINSANEYARPVVRGSSFVQFTTSRFGGGALQTNSGALANSGVIVTDSAQAGIDLISSSVFTVEGWFYPTLSSTTLTMLATSFPSNTSFELARQSNGQVILFRGGTTGIANSADSFIPNNAWAHIAVTFNGTTDCRLFVNGVLAGVGSNAGNAGQSPDLLIGASSQYGGNFVGYSDEVRLTNGVARYTNSFTPPTAPFPENSVDDPHWNNVTVLTHFDGFMPFNPKLDAERALRVRRQEFWGYGLIYGTVKADGTPDYPVSRKVQLLREIDGRCIDETWSNSTTGYYEFRYIDPTLKYTVVAFDYTGSFLAVVADNITPELIP